ncbi:hypothetical protein DZC73_28500 [Albitalea terrae]|uniref:Uncharacterized protein n=2 Tax=Piscinibacter terrae TaxID=2496871 RepID=A0A3N7HLF1_9BURK|nr:hypothetical protein DZC73_28500 [Albitalea terrae]
MAGCATRSDLSTSKPVIAQSSAPARYASTVDNYFDLTMPAQATPRKLYIGTPEKSRCALFGTGGRHAGWMVPVIYDTTPPAAPPSSTPGRTSKNANALPQPLHVNTSGTASANTSTSPMSLKEVSITGTRYFFWFSSETLAAVTRQADNCP